MKHLILSGCLLVGWCTGFCQTINYKVLNRTDSLSPIKVSLTVDMRNIVSADGAGLMVEGVLGNRLSYSARWNKYFFTMARLGKDATNTAGYQNFSNGSLWEAGLEWYVLSAKAKGKMVKVTTSSSSWSERYFLATVPRRRILLLRAGVNQLRQPFFIGSNADSSYRLLSGKDPLIPASDNFYYTRINTFVWYGGIGYRKLYKAKMKAGDGWGYFKFKSWKMYVDLLSGVTSFSDLTDDKGKTHSDISYSQLSNIGYRLGMEEEMMGVTTNIEVGRWPGPAFGGILTYYNYLNLSFRFNLYGSDKRYRMKGR